jgi:STE24 endopeptidase
VTTDRPQLDTERQTRARLYSRLRRRVGLLELFLGLAYLGLLIGTGAAGRLASQLDIVSGGSWPVTLVLMAGCLALPWFLVTLPFGYYTGFHLPHRFGQSTQTLEGWLADLV